RNAVVHILGQHRRDENAHHAVEDHGDGGKACDSHHRDVDGQIHHTGDAEEHAGNQERKELDPVDVDAGIVGNGDVGADGADIGAKGGAAVEHVEDDEHHRHDDDAPGHASQIALG